MANMHPNISCTPQATDRGTHGKLNCSGQASPCHAFSPDGTLAWHQFMEAAAAFQCWWNDHASSCATATGGTSWYWCRHVQPVTNEVRAGAALTVMNAHAVAAYGNGDFPWTPQLLLECHVALHGMAIIISNLSALHALVGDAE